MSDCEDQLRDWASKLAQREIERRPEGQKLKQLNELKQKGTKAFVGSCCEAFYAKHQEDFQQAGLPGILIDIDSQTCYDLGLEREAKKGKFENQTNLRMELIQRIVEYLK